MGAEALIQYEILSAWGAHPRLRIWRQNTGGATIKGRVVRFGVPGCADILGVIGPHGRLLAIEVKSATGRQTEDQLRFQRVIEHFGGVYVLARSLADVDAVLLPLVGAR